MKRYRTILVGASLDDRDFTTLRHAARFAQAAESEAVYVAHIVPTFDLPTEAGENQSELVVPVDEEIEQRLHVAVEGQRHLFPPRAVIQVVVRQGSFVPELVRLAAQKSADLLCIGRHPPEDHDRVSDTAMQLLDKALCSVLVVPPSPEPNYERILVPVDFSEHSREALDAAFAIAQSQRDASVTVLHVYSVPLGWHKSPHSYEEFAAILKGHAERRWADFLSSVDTRGAGWTIRFELGDKVPQTILNVAEEIDASLVVLASHGRTRPAEFLLGHVADTVCARTSRPVLCVKRKGEVVNFLRALLQLFEFDTE